MHVFNFNKEMIKGLRNCVFNMLSKKFDLPSEHSIDRLDDGILGKGLDDSDFASVDNSKVPVLQVTSA